jgi:RNA-directed DNA polymerase
MSLATPEKIRSLQRKLYCKAKAEPAFRFYVLYDKICRDDILSHAYGLARANAGAPGVDGVSFAEIEEQGLEAWLAGLREDLVLKTYRPDPVRRVLIPKPDGGERPLGIPTIRDRVVQTAAKLVLEPIFEADFEDNAYGYRPARGAVDAVKDVHRHLCRGYTDVVDADLSRFNTARRPPQIGGSSRRGWGRAAADQAVAEGTGRGTGCRRDPEHEWRQEQQAPHPARWCREPAACQHLHEPVPEALASERLRRSAPCPRRLLADDFVILSRGYAAEALAWTKAVMTKLGLTLNEAKTSLKDARQERFDFLGYSFGPHWFKSNGKWYLGASPSKKSVQRLKTKVSDLLVPNNLDPWVEVRDTLNKSLRGWSNYFCYGTRGAAFQDELKDNRYAFCGHLGLIV